MPASTPSSIASRSLHLWALTARTCCAKPSIAGRNFGAVSIVGIYGGLLARSRWVGDQPWPDVSHGQTPVQCYLPKLLERIEDPSFVITHRATLDEGPVLYNIFRAKKDGCIKVVMKPYSDDAHSDRYVGLAL